VLRMDVLRYDGVLNWVKVLVRISDLSGSVVRYCVVRLDNVFGKAEPKCVDNENQAWKNTKKRRCYLYAYVSLRHVLSCA